MRLARIAGARIELDGGERAELLERLVAAALDARMGGVGLTLSEWEAFEQLEREAWTEAGRRLMAMQAYQQARGMGGDPKALAWLLGGVDEETGRAAMAEFELTAGLAAVAHRFETADEAL